MAVQSEPTGRLVIRADASEVIGGGHVMRCLALAGAWVGRDGAAASGKCEVMFVCAEVTKPLKARIAREGHLIRAIGSERGSDLDADLTRNIAREWRADAVVIDGYCFGLTYQERLRDKSFIRVLYDDQGQAPSFDCEILVNQNISACARDYAGRAPGATLLLGSQFAALRPEFLVLRRHQRRNYDSAHKVLVSLGLSDTTQSLRQILEGFDRITDVQLTIEVLSGAGDPVELERIVTMMRHQVLCVPTVDNFAQKLVETDIAILAGGGTAHEAACLGTPMIMVCVADNQAPAYREFVRRGAALDGGVAGEIDPVTFAAVAAEMLGSAQLRATCAAAARAAVDGQGAQRVSSQIRQLSKKASLGF